MSSLDKMKRHLDKGFKSRATKPTACIETYQDAVFYIEDVVKDRCRARFPKEVTDFDKVFEVINPNKKEIALFAVDGCFIKHKPEHCDFICFDDATFCFGEMKFESETKSYLQIDENRNKAVNQLKSTILIFKEALQDNFLDYDVEAYVCTPPHYPNKGTALDAFVLEFIEDLGGISLFEKNEKTFL